MAEARTGTGADAGGDGDEAVLRRVAAGDRAAFDLFHARFHGPVRGFAERITGAGDRADEVASDTMLAVWNGAAGFEGRSRVSTWVFGIAYRIALKSRHRDRRERSHVAIDEAAALPDPAAVPAEVALDRGKVAAALRALPLELRAVMELTYFYGHTVADVAAVIGCPPGTVKSRMHAARRTLREALE